MASIVFHGPSKKRKNRINSARLFDFGNSAVSGANNSGAFRDNIRSFLQSFGEIEDYTVCDMTVWFAALVSEADGVLPLYVIEETVEDSLDPFCKHCESSGWGHHFVCKRRYHFIIPAKQNWNLPLDEDFGEVHNHKLYGLIHCNGYGHLLGINALKTNSKFSTADDCMVLWDRLCSVLKVRSISAHNTTRKEAIDRNLIHGAAYGKSWFEKWGYRFGDGWQESAEHKYISAVRFLGSLSLDKIIIDSKKKRNAQRIPEMINCYRKSSEKPLATMSDLLKFMLASQSRHIYNTCNSGTGDQSPVMGFKTFLNSMMTDCRWSAKRLEHVLFVIIDLLKCHTANSAGTELCGISRQELRDEARKTIGDTGLIDFVLKSIKSFRVGNLVIRRLMNPFSRLTEFAIHEISDRGLMGSPDIARDVRFIYENVIQGYFENQPFLSCNAVFMKDWPMRGGVGNQSMMLMCKVLPDFDEMETELTRPLSPGEVVVVEPWITIGDLRMVAQCALRDTYCMMDRFEVAQIGGLRKIEDECALLNTVEPGSQVWVRGHGLDLQTRLRYEDGGPKMRARCA
ncbi:PHD finger protein MALE MEIOCYTE DEATH 1 [Striga hermonthica]|uniref:PHD finger protein MALE MEIOCYTE DEATH 1 n=1 Tax=Striga hermonthica TaxID=68872 RepID=A0A9N7R506_STRHE|nr:PHD finger protein MALE MEIOCYTE DEATH 1 [Striga hermonthica]